MTKKKRGSYDKGVISGDVCFRAARSHTLYLPGKCPLCLKRKPCGCGRAPCPPTTCPSNPCLPCQDCGPASYLVTFEANGGEPVPLPQTVPYGGKVARPEDPARTGYLFEGWYQTPDFSGALWDFDADMVAENIALYARWAPALYMVTFESNGGFPVPSPQVVPYGELAIRPADPLRAGFIFSAWYPTPDFSGSPWAFNTGVVTSNITLYARWLLPLV